MRKGLGPILASVMLSALVLVFGGCGNSIIKKARALQDEKKYDEAIQQYKLALEKDPTSNEARYGVIEAYSQQLNAREPEKVKPEDVEKVMGELRPIAQPLMSDPNIKRYVSLVYQMLAKRYAEQGRDDKAADAWSEVIEIEPTFAEAHFNRGLALSMTGKYEEAIVLFEKAISLNPYFVKGYHALGDALVRLERYEDAAQQYLKALELNPDDAAVHHNLGLSYYRGGDTEKAVAEYQKALELEPDYAYAYKSLHEVYEKAGDKKKLKEIDAKWKESTEKLLKALHESHGTASQEESEKSEAVTTGS
jgi:tetratricopeptide (TPR) repeat protein